MSAPTSTVAETRCPLTELIVEHCAHCRGFDDLPAEFRIVWVGHLRVGRSCDACHEPIRAGARAARTAAGDYLHAECAE